MDCGVGQHSNGLSSRATGRGTNRGPAVEGLGFIHISMCREVFQQGVSLSVDSWKREPVEGRPRPPGSCCVPDTRANSFVIPAGLYVD